MTKPVRYFAYHKVTRGILQTGFDTMDEAKEQAEFLAQTYGGLASVSENRLDAVTERYTVKRGWH